MCRLPIISSSKTHEQSPDTVYIHSAWPYFFSHRRTFFLHLTEISQVGLVGPEVSISSIHFDRQSPSLWTNGQGVAAPSSQRWLRNSEWKTRNRVTRTNAEWENIQMVSLLERIMFTIWSRAALSVPWLLPWRTGGRKSRRSQNSDRLSYSSKTLDQFDLSCHLNGELREYIIRKGG